MLARVGDQIFAVPQAAVREVAEFEADAIRALQGAEVVEFRGAPLPIAAPVERTRPRAVRDATRFHAFIIGTGAAAVGLLVDRIVGHREIVVRSTADPLIRVDGVTGATDLGDGKAVLILDAARDRAAGPRSQQPPRPDRGPGDRMTADNYILFTVAGTSYALPSQDVAHVEMVDQVTRVPNAPAFVDGVVFSRGQVVPAINMRARFGFERAPLDVASRLLVVQSHGRSVGLLVDACREFLNVPQVIDSSAGRSALGTERAVHRRRRKHW